MDANESEYGLPTKVTNCFRCAEHWFANAWALKEAFASVGIEHGKSSWQMAEEYFESYHKSGHRDG